LRYPIFSVVVVELFESPAVVAEKRVMRDSGPFVETYVWRFMAVFENFVLREVGGQVNDVCGGNA
jgi:hypothetical protein